jgi:hypothetical protein
MEGLISVYSIDETAERLENLIHEDAIVRNEIRRIVHGYFINNVEKAKNSIIYEEKDGTFYLKKNYKDIILEEIKNNEEFLNLVSKRYERLYAPPISLSEIKNKMNIFKRSICDFSFEKSSFLAFKKCIC